MSRAGVTVEVVAPDPASAVKNPGSLSSCLWDGYNQGGDRMTEHQAADSGPGTADRANEVTPVEVFTAAMEAEVHRRVVGDRRHGLALPDPPAAG